MPDHSKCLGVDCPIREKCWRYISPDSGLRQSYVEFGPPGEDCEGFVSATKKEIENALLGNK